MSSLHDILEGLLKSNNPYRIKTICKGSSMSPFIMSGDSVIISPVYSTTKLTVGTIVVISYPTRKKIIFHRIIKANGQLYLIKGDNISTPDGWINYDQIIGRVDSVVKKRFSYRCCVSLNFIIALLSKSGFFLLLNKGLSYVSGLWRQLFWNNLTA